MSRPTRALALGLLPLLLLTGLILVVAAGLKSYCLTDWQPGDQPKVCYNDIQTLWHLRDMDQHVAPYQARSSTPSMRRGTRSSGWGPDRSSTRW